MQKTVRTTRADTARVKRFIAEEDLIRSGDRVLAAVSGGPDSTCLLLLLAALRRPLQFELQAAYFDHELRGRRAATAERRFVEGVCDSLGVPLHAGAGDVRTHAKMAKRSIEDAARTLRYRFLASVGRQHECDVIATGHTKDDQAETVLLHLIRGSGLRGLAGMSPSSSMPLGGRTQMGLRLVRPMLTLSRKDTERHCRNSGLAPIDDASNRSSAFARNRVRHELLPALRRFNPRIEDALAGLADSAAADDATLDAIAHALVDDQDRSATIDKRSLCDAPPAIAARAVRIAFASAMGASRDLARRHIDAVLRTARSPSASLDLPGGVVVDVQRSSVLFRLRHALPRALPARAIGFPVPGSAKAGGWCFEARVVAAPNGRALGGEPLEAYLDLEACGERLTVRRRRDGDRFQPFGMAGEKKLQDFFVDERVPRCERDATPLLCAGGRIAWVVGRRPAEWAKVPQDARRAVCIRAVPPPDRSSRIVLAES
jgi:tRNA(Ile)-lysidine synthase